MGADAPSLPAPTQCVESGNVSDGAASECTNSKAPLLKPTSRAATPASRRVFVPASPAAPSELRASVVAGRACACPILTRRVQSLRSSRSASKAQRQLSQPVRCVRRWVLQRLKPVIFCNLTRFMLRNQRCGALRSRCWPFFVGFGGRVASQVVGEDWLFGARRWCQIT